MENASTTLERVSMCHEGSESVTDAVLRAVAEREGCSQLELPLLYESVDPDALNELFAASRAFDGGSVAVEFEYAGYLVCIAEPGAVELRPADSDLRVLESGYAD